jgi:hypothetical protein
MTDNKLETLIAERKKSKRGGARPGAGRKRRMEEHEIIEKLSPMADIAFKVLKEKIAEGDMKAIQIFCSYFIGLPTQKIENKIEGQLNQVSVEVIKPNVLEKVA